MKRLDARTYGELIAILTQQRCSPVMTKGGREKLDEDGNPVTYQHAVRNRLDSFEFHADRMMIRDEFLRLWEKQSAFGGPLAERLTDDLKTKLDNPEGDDTFRHRGLLFGQRRTYWDLGTLGRCDLEPTDACVPQCDRHASYFRVVESVNNIRIRDPGTDEFRALSEQERANVIDRLRSQKTGSVATIRRALGIDKRSLKKHDLAEGDVPLNIERDPDRQINTDWFHREIVLGVVGEDAWAAWSESAREGLNRAILKFDPKVDGTQPRLRNAAARIGLSSDSVDRLIEAWQQRPNVENRLNLSRRAVLNLLPYMERYDKKNDRWPTQIEARRSFAEDEHAIDATRGQPATERQRERYRLGGNQLTKSDRQFLKEHPDLVAPAPTMGNPVVRKAIHEVRNHVIAHIREHGCKPDRVVIEFARETTKPAKVNDRILARNRKREKIRKRILEEIVKLAHGQNFSALSHNQIRTATERVLLCLQQRGVCAYSTDALDGDEEGACAYSGRAITLRQAALGNGLEIDHIIPYSRCGDNSLNNRVLCYRDENRHKKNLTPREWWRDQFDRRSAPLRFMDGYRPDKNDYFEARDYAAKWRNYSRKDAPQQWRGSQLSDTAYAAREVQTYLHQALWPDEPTYLEGNAERRIYVTKGAYTSQLRKDWQLYQRLLPPGASREDVQHASAKNRGDHREHAVDAVAIALTDPVRILELARYAKALENERVEAASKGHEPRRIKREPLEPPWGTVRDFRRQVLSQLYDEIDPLDKEDRDEQTSAPIVVSHRPSGKKISGSLHEDSLFGPLPDSQGTYVARKRAEDLKSNHLRLPDYESPQDAIARFAKIYQDQDKAKNQREARKLAKKFVQSPAYKPRKVDPPPGKPGLVRDLKIRRIIRDEINNRLNKLGINRDADSFTAGDLKKILDDGPLRMPSGVPIRRVVLLRTMKDPVIVPRRRYDHKRRQYVRDTGKDGDLAANERSRADRAYVGGNNHHIEIRENEKGEWTGLIVPMFDAARRVRVENLEPVDRSDDEGKGGRFIMSLSEGETVYMLPKDAKAPGYFVVFKLDKPRTIQFKHHWDARRAKGEKNDEGDLIPDSKREEIPVSAIQLRDLAPPGHETPVKVDVDPLGRPRVVEPPPPKQFDAISELDPRIVAIARDAIELRRQRNGDQPENRRRLPGSWKWMHTRLKEEGLESAAAQLSAAMRLLRKQE